MQVLVASAALVVALTAPPNPFTLDTPAPTASIVPLPEIGRVRSATPACAAMRDLVIPSFAAARRADVRFAESSKTLPRYIDVAEDKLAQGTAYRESLLAKLDSDASKLLQESNVLSHALGDPRLSPDSKDEQVHAERAQLQQLFDTQRARASLLAEFVLREQVKYGASGIGDNSAFNAKTRTGNVANFNPTPSPVPGQTTSPNMPLMTGLSMSDKNALNAWTGGISADVRASENKAAKTFLPIARSCR